jgi:hypothetical protein
MHIFTVHSAVQYVTKYSIYYSATHKLPRCFIFYHSDTSKCSWYSNCLSTVSSVTEELGLTWVRLQGGWVPRFLELLCLQQAAFLCNTEFDQLH